jgi:hypothetical protein
VIYAARTKSANEQNNKKGISHQGRADKMPSSCIAQLVRRFDALGCLQKKAGVTAARIAQELQQGGHGAAHAV